MVETLVVALLRRYGLRPYRYHRQRTNTVMVRIPRSFEGTLWPEFIALDEALREHLDAVAHRVISEAIAGDTCEAEEIRGCTPGRMTVWTERPTAAAQQRDAPDERGASDGRSQVISVLGRREQNERRR